MFSNATNILFPSEKTCSKVKAGHHRPVGHCDDIFHESMKVILQNSENKKTFDENGGFLDFCFSFDEMKLFMGLIYNASDKQFKGFAMGQNEIPDVITTVLQENMRDFGIDDFEDRKVGLATSLWQSLFVLETGKDSFLGPHFITNGGMLASQMNKEVPTIVVNAQMKRYSSIQPMHGCRKHQYVAYSCFSAGTL